MKPLLHSFTARQIDQAVAGEQGGYIFHGITGVGKTTTALYWAGRLNCAGHNDGICKPCRQLAASSYPDVIVLRPEDRPSISIEQVRTLTATLSLSPYVAGGRRAVIIDDAHLLTTEAQNALLKVIEEPPPRTHIILVAEQLEALLPTVRSRLMHVYFTPVETSSLAGYLEKEHGVATAEALHLAQLAGGATGLALRLLHDPAALATLTSLEQAATQARTAPIFDRLVLARQLAENKTSLQQFAQTLHQQLLQELRLGAGTPAQTTQRLTATEQFRRGLEANLSPRVAVERLMLEL
jgi:DNA polymerase III subunit delta'